MCVLLSFNSDSNLVISYLTLCVCLRVSACAPCAAHGRRAERKFKALCCQLQDEERRRQQQLEEMRKREAEDRARQEDERRRQEEERTKRDAEEKVMVL